MSTKPIDKIELIKFMRHFTKGTLSLTDAKNIAEALHAAELVRVVRGCKVEYPRKD